MTAAPRGEVPSERAMEAAREYRRSDLRCPHGNGILLVAECNRCLALALDAFRAPRPAPTDEVGLRDAALEAVEAAIADPIAYSTRMNRAILTLQKEVRASLARAGARQEVEGG